MFPFKMSRLLSHSKEKMMEEKIIYFEKPGKENTSNVIQLTKERAQARGERDTSPICKYAND
jgi:hypothetical protein